jgi:hypothetical protein
MNILFLGKLPPIQGGVSCDNLWLLSALCAMGHHVTTVANASEVESTYRMCFLPGDVERLHELLPPVAVSVASTTRVTERAYIPWASPFVSQLFGRALCAARKSSHDVIFASYWEPYGVVGAHLSSVLSIPLVVRHAGSDLGRLAHHVDLRATYQWMLDVAAGLIVTNIDEVRKLFKIDERRLIPVRRARLPSVFSTKAVPLRLLSGEEMTA